MIYKQFIFKERLPLMNRALDAYAMRQRTIAKNIANASTPHYNPEKVKFEEHFRDERVALEGARSNDLHIPIGSNESGGRGEIQQADIPEAEVYFSGDSHVNIDKEMSELAQNQIRFRFGARMLKNYFTGMTSAIFGTKQ